jgi:hypothetical protein
MQNRNVIVFATHAIARAHPQKFLADRLGAESKPLRCLHFIPSSDTNWARRFADVWDKSWCGRAALV